jgi:nitroimidazol reductase NimA-like FMN-containing flavoprotein (pyridoxamine 5'-phosphate oxidase superfamily)
MGGLDLSLTPEERDRFLEEQRTLRLATVGDGGEPQVVPLWFVWLDGAVFFNTTLGNRSIRSVEVRPRAAATVDDGDTYGELRGVTFRGRVERSDDDPRIGDVKAAYARKYHGGGPVPFDRWRDRAWFRLIPDHEASWDFRKIPEARERARAAEGTRRA